MVKNIGKYIVDFKYLYKDSTSEEKFKVCPMNKRFLVSNMARCYDMKKEKFIKDYTPNKSPYNKWWLCDYEDDYYTKINNCYDIHRVVAETWCKKPSTKERLVVDHIDGDKHNNLSSNLRWITYKENSNAQDVQERKANELKKTVQHRKEIQALTKVIEEKDEEIERLKKVKNTFLNICKLRAHQKAHNNIEKEIADYDIARN